MTANAEQYVAIYSRDSAARCIVSLFELVALARRPHGTPFEQLDAHTFRATHDDPVLNRMLLRVTNARARYTAGLHGTPWFPPATTDDRKPAKKGKRHV